MTTPIYDVIVIGAGPNGLSAAIATARAGFRTLVVEAHATPGGGARTSELTLPGFHHDVCSSVHPLGAGSPWFGDLDLGAFGLAWVTPPAALAHVMGDGRVVTLERSVVDTAAQLGEDRAAYTDLMGPLADRFAELAEMFLGPLRLPAAPILAARFGLRAIRSLRGLVRRFRGDLAPALLGGIAAHGMVPLEATATAAIALMLGLAGHAVGWPLARGGSRAITDALVATLRAHGGELELGTHVTSLRQLPVARAYVFDTSPRALLRIAGDRLPARYRARLERFRYGPGVYKMDWALAGPIPWRDPRAARAATVHLSGDVDHIAASERAVHAGAVGPRPFTLVVQPTLFDPTRAPAGKHIAWAYCHVPAGQRIDASALLEDHIEQFAPGFRDLVLARAARDPIDVETYDANYVGGDINGGLSDLRQLFFRPVAKADPYSTPARDIFMCSSSTPPGGGVHGMCGYWAARSVLQALGSTS